MFNFIKKFFKKKEEKYKNETSEDIFKNVETKRINLKKFELELDNYNPSKKSLIILDDSEGIVSVLLDDIDYLHENKLFDKSKINIITFTSQYAGFQLLATVEKYNGLNISHGIFDITLGGGIYDDYYGNIVFDGVDSFISCHKMNRNMKFYFYTGNQLNPYISKNLESINKFKKYTNENINEFILYKTSLSIQDRRNFLLSFLKNEDIKLNINQINKKCLN